MHNPKNLQNLPCLVNAFLYWLPSAIRIELQYKLKCHHFGCLRSSFKQHWKLIKLRDELCRELNNAMTWKHFSYTWLFVRESTGPRRIGLINDLYDESWALIFPLLPVVVNRWTKCVVVDDLRRCDARVTSVWEIYSSAIYKYIKFRQIQTWHHSIASQRARNAIITSSLCQHDVALTQLSLRHYCVMCPLGFN